MKRMMIASLFLIIGCKEEKKDAAVAQPEPEVKENVVQETKPQVNEAEEAKKWLEKSIEDYFKSDLGNLDKNMQKITTKEYYDYKGDAMGVDMDVDGSLTEKEFNDKWKGKFDTKKAGVGVGFLIAGQDWDKVQVTKCELISENENNYLFDVVLNDKELKAVYPVKVRVSKENNSFLIADVLQDTPEFN